MKKTFLFILLGGIVVLTSCGSTKNTTTQNTTHQGRVVRESNPIEELANDSITRAFGVSTFRGDHEEQIARKDAIMAAREELASNIEAAIVSVYDRFVLKGNKEERAISESMLKGAVKEYVAQKISATPIKSIIYDNADGTSVYYVCIEMNNKLSDVVNGALDRMSQDDILSVEFDRQQFNKEVKEDMAKLKSGIGL